jgi:hypothetical protein
MKHTPHEQPIKTGKFGPKLDDKSMQNNPFRAAIQDGHMLNESYKMPVPNSSGTNLSYHHPTGGAKTQVKANKAPMVTDGKNTF